MPVTKILIVEDEVLIAEDLRLILQRMGHQVVGTASSGTEAIEKANKLHPDLVLMDVRLQGVIDGVEAARRIRSTADIPIIYVTAYASVLASLDLNDRCTRLAKPFSPLQLQAAIAAVLGDTQKQAQ
jgi:two-component system, cell cycle sensor histidine kinase and response regulator CckA